MVLEYNLITRRFEDTATWISLNDPIHGNALSFELISQLHEALKSAASNHQCRSVILSASGDTFCEGLDLQCLVDQEGNLSSEIGYCLVNCLIFMMNMDIPIIAKVSGFTAGGGLGLLAASDIVLVDADSCFALPEVAINMMPCLVTPFLLRRISMANIRYLALCTKKITAQQACSIGLADEVHVTDNLNAATYSVLRRIRRSSSEAIASTKHYFLDLQAKVFANQIQIASVEFDNWLNSESIRSALQFYITEVVSND